MLYHLLHSPGITCYDIQYGITCDITSHTKSSHIRLMSSAQIFEDAVVGEVGAMRSIPRRCAVIQQAHEIHGLLHLLQAGRLWRNQTGSGTSTSELGPAGTSELGPFSLCGLVSRAKHQTATLGCPLATGARGTP